MAYDGQAAERYVRALDAEIAAAPAVQRTSTLFTAAERRTRIAPERVGALDAHAACERFALADGAEVSLEVESGSRS